MALQCHSACPFTAWQLSLARCQHLVLISVIDQGHVVMYMGNWVAPFGITLVADMLSAIMVVLTGMMAVAIAIFSLSSASPSHERFWLLPAHALASCWCSWLVPNR